MSEARAKLQHLRKSNPTGPCGLKGPARSVAQAFGEGPAEVAADGTDP